ncbi:MAG: Alanine racemase [Phycisphaerae bacterium]|nr:Alanine racemase [Phycisphaerae bacterium]
MRSRHVSARVDLDRIRASAERIRASTGVELLAVVKADAYGLGAIRVADALAAVVDEFAYFSIDEAREVGRPGLVIGPADGEAAWHQELGVRPCVASVEQARRYASIGCALSVDTGMQRFGCPDGQIDEILAAAGGAIDEAMTHTARPEGARRLRELLGGRSMKLHAASSALLDTPDAWLDAVRPGVALYRGALRVSARLESVRQTHGPAGYTRFHCPRVGVILAGYSNFLREGPAVINGRRQQILEVGMNSSYVSVDAHDRVGDEVVLLGDELPEAVLAGFYCTREHEILCRYGAMGPRTYAPIDDAPLTCAGDTTRSCDAAPLRTAPSACSR